MQVNLTKNLEIANIGYRVRPNILRADLEAGKNITKELWTGRAKPVTQIVSENNYLSILGLRRIFWTGNSLVYDFLLC